LKLDIAPSSLTSLASHLKSLTLHHRALVELQNHIENSALAAKKHLTSAAPVVERLGEYPAAGHVDLEKLVEWPPRLRAVPVKPLFLDTAWNYIEYPGRGGEKEKAGMVANVEEKADEGGKKKKGWFGF
jgi:signal recognition particle subunit SRP68